MYCKYISIIMLHCNKKVFISFYTKWTSIVTLLTKNHMSGSFKYAVYNKMKKNSLGVLAYISQCQASKQKFVSKNKIDLRVKFNRSTVMLRHVA